MARLIPAEYKQVEYLQTVGYETRIDTGVPGNDNTLAFDFEVAALVTRNYGALFGNYLSETSKCWRFMLADGSNIISYYLGSTHNSQKANSAFVLRVVPSGESLIGKRVSISMTASEVKSMTPEFANYANKITVTAIDSETISNNNIIIGAPGPTSSGYSELSFRIWRFRISQNGTQIRDYVPCVRRSNGLTGFYDTVNDTFNPSIGLANFIAGPNAQYCPEMNNLRRSILMNTPHTATDSDSKIAIFQTDMVTPFAQLDVTWHTYQNLNGYSQPWAPGRGKNLYDNVLYPLTDGKYIDARKGTVESYFAYAATLDFIPVEHLAGETVTLNIRPAGTNDGFAFYSTNSESGYLSGEKNNGAASGGPWTITIPSGAKYMRFTTLAASIANIQIEKGSTSTSYEPYANICSIEGRNGTNIYRFVENVYDASMDEPGYMLPGGSVTVDSVSAHSALIPVIPGESYEFAGEHIVSYSANKRIHGYDRNGNYSLQLGVFYVNSPQRYRIVVNIPDNIYYVVLSFYSSDLNRAFGRYDIDTIYSPIYPNTTLDGTLRYTPKQNILYVRKQSASVDGNSGWNVTGGGKFYLQIPVSNFIQGTALDELSNIYLFGGYANGGSTQVTTDNRFYLQYVGPSSSYNRIWVYDTQYTSLADFKNALNLQPLRFTYSITPEVYTGTPQAQNVIRTKHGFNYIWTGFSDGFIDTRYWTH